jgi:hypothetical protein|eukprot:COSAG06_NODE_4981_length_3810_cov_2.264619_7_plen_50_part_00
MQKSWFPLQDIVSTWLAEGYPAGLNAPDFEEGAGEKELANKLKELGAKL